MSAKTELSPLESRLLRDVAQRAGAPLGHVALAYGLRFDEETDTLYRQAQD